MNFCSLQPFAFGLIIFSDLLLYSTNSLNFLIPEPLVFVFHFVSFFLSMANSTITAARVIVSLCWHWSGDLLHCPLCHQKGWILCQACSHLFVRSCHLHMLCFNYRNFFGYLFEQGGRWGLDSIDVGQKRLEAYVLPYIYMVAYRLLLEVFGLFRFMTKDFNVIILF